MFPSFQLDRLNKLFFPWIITFIKGNTTIAHLHGNWLESLAKLSSYMSDLSGPRQFTLAQKKTIVR